MITRILAIAAVGGAVAAVRAPDDSKLPVCIGTDGSIKVRAGATCPAGGKKYTLIGMPGDMVQGAGFSLSAPFQVVDPQGKTLLRVYQSPEHQGGVMSVVGATGVEEAFVSAAADGGFFKAKSKAGYPEVSVGTVANYGGLVIRDAPGQFRASIFLENGAPGLSLRTPSYIPFASITQGSSGGGLLELGDAAGNGQVRLGITPGGCGRVETYPERPGNTRAITGLSSFIVGNCK